MQLEPPRYVDWTTIILPNYLRNRDEPSKPRPRVQGFCGGRMTKPIDPPHYTSHKIEPIQVIEAWNLGFHLGNALKYIARANHKGSRRDDLIKAANYCFREATGKWLPQEVLNVLVKEVPSRAEGDTPRPAQGLRSIPRYGPEEGT